MSVNMRNFATLAVFAAGANAFVSRDTSCCFHITASGDASGSVGQLGDGQNRIGDDRLPAGQFCIDQNGSITDGSGRGCILTPPTTQFQCDTGATPTPGFSVNQDGQLEYNGQTGFVACETGENGGLNIYTSPDSEDVSGCVNVQLMADSCAGSGSGGGGGASSSVPAPSSTPVQAPSPSPSSPGQGTSTVPVASPSPSGTGATGGGGDCSECVPTTTLYTTVTVDCSTGTPGVPGGGSGGEMPTGPAGGGETPTGPAETQTPTSPAGGGETQTPTPSSGSCPTDLSGDYEYPHLIIPVDSSSPDEAPGTSYNGTVSSIVSTIFNFDIPQSDAGKTCSLVFLFPKLEDLETSSYSFSGDGKVSFAALESPAEMSTSYSNAPAVSQNLGDFTISPGNSYSISSFECPAGQAIGVEMSNAGSTELDFFEDYNPSPLGLYITVC